MEETTVAVVRVTWGKSSPWWDTTLILSWGIHIGSGGSLLGTLIRVVTLHSTLKTSDLGLVLDGDRHNIASSPRGSVGVGGSIVVVELGWCTSEIAVVAGVVMVSSGTWVYTVGIGRTVHRGSVGSRGKSWRDGLGRYFGI